MPASLAEIEIQGGMSGLKCPITGVDVIVPNEGFDPDAEHSPHLRFFIDWIGETYAANPADLPPEQVEYQTRIISIISGAPEASRSALVNECLAVLPKSALVLKIMDPAMGSYDGEICYACFDLGEPAEKGRIRLQHVEASE